MALDLGAVAPDFSLPDQDDEIFELSAHRGQRLLLVFYPGDDTPVCTRQLCDYRDGLESFADLGVRVIGLSPDDAGSHRRFREKHGLPFTLLSDQNLEVASRYGCKALIGMKRGVYLLDEQQRIRYRHIELVALFRRQRAELIEAVRQLG